jgi:hypothetical protein
MLSVNAQRQEMYRWEKCGGVAMWTSARPAGGGASLFAAPFVAATGLGVGASVAGSFGLRALCINVWGTTDLKHDVHNTIQHLCCAQCRYPVKYLR